MLDKSGPSIEPCGTPVGTSSVKWTVLAHFGSQPHGQNFQAQTWWTVLAHLILDSIKY